MMVSVILCCALCDLSGEECGIVCVVIFTYLIYLIVSCARRSLPVYSIVYNAVVLTDIYIMILVLTTCQYLRACACFGY